MVHHILYAYTVPCALQDCDVSLADWLTGGRGQVKML